MKKLIPILFLLFSFVGFSQDNNNNFSHSIGYSPFKLELNSQTLHKKLEPKFVSSLDYIFYVKNIGFVGRVEYGENLINDNCNSCADHFYGEGKMKEFNSEIGIRYQIGRIKNWRLQPQLGILGYFSSLNYSGNFDGGFSGGGTNYGEHFNTFGLKLQAGFSIRLSQQFFLDYTASGQFGNAIVRSNVNGATYKYTSGAGTLVKVGLRYFL